MEEGALSNGSSFPVSVSAVSVTVCLRRPSAAPACASAASAAGVFTADLARGHRVIARLQAGTCWINAYNLTPVEMPFGAVKASGVGRENSRAAVEHYTQVKAVYVGTSPVDSPY